MSIVPKEKFDIETAKALSGIGSSDIIRDIDALLEWLQDPNWPVYPFVLERLLQLKGGFEDSTRKILQGEDSIWKYWIISDFISALPEDKREEFHSELELLMLRSTDSDNVEGVITVVENLLNQGKDNI